MQRREFMEAAAGVVAGGMIGRHAPRLPGFTASTAGSTRLDAVWYHANRRLASTAFGRIAYVEHGTGPAALFIHGLPLNGFQWRGALKRLAPLRRCIAPDSMALGYSEILAGQSVAPGAQADMLVAFLERLGITSVDLVANDSGGAIAQIFVARYPERVRTILLTNCDVHEDSPPAVIQPLLEKARAGTLIDEVILPLLRDKSFARSQSGLGGVYTYPDNPTDEAIDYYLTPVVSSPLRRDQCNRYHTEMEPNPLLAIEPALRRCQAPLRVVWGTGDTIFDPSSPDWLDRTFPNSRGVRRIEGAKLFFPEEMPDIIAEEARRLWMEG